MSSEIEKSGRIGQFYEDLKKCRKILLELQRTMDTDGCYNPFNKVADPVCNVVAECRQTLERIEA